MKTKDQVEKEFREDLRKLLEKWGAEIQVEISGNATGVIDVYVDGVWDADGNTVSEYASFDIGSWCNKDNV